MPGLAAMRASAQARHQLGHDRPALRHLVARVQRRELDRDAGVGADVVRPQAGGDRAMASA
jgi:hypothetical protein